MDKLASWDITDEGLSMPTYSTPIFSVWWIRHHTHYAYMWRMTSLHAISAMHSVSNRKNESWYDAGTKTFHVLVNVNQLEREGRWTPEDTWVLTTVLLVNVMSQYGHHIPQRQTIIANLDTRRAIKDILFGYDIRLTNGFLTDYLHQEGITMYVTVGTYHPGYCRDGMSEGNRNRKPGETLACAKIHPDKKYGQVSINIQFMKAKKKWDLDNVARLIQDAYALLIHNTWAHSPEVVPNWIQQRFVTYWKSTNKRLWITPSIWFKVKGRRPHPFVWPSSHNYTGGYQYPLFLQTN